MILVYLDNIGLICISRVLSKMFESIYFYILVFKVLYLMTLIYISQFNGFERIIVIFEMIDIEF